MDTPIEVLRVEQVGISKELARFRACDPETRSLYCREWAQFIYKKHFVWNAKTQEEVPENQLVPTSLTAGKYQINFIFDKQQGDEDLDQPVYKKERSALMSKKFEKLVETWSSSTQPDEESLITQILKACQLWMTLPSGYSGLPNLFEPVEFNPYPDAIPLVDDVKDPSQLLDPLIIERQALCLPSDCFHLLKNLTGDILLSHTTPTCNHTKPRHKTPADLEVERAIFNEHEAEAVQKALKELTMALERAWHPLDNFLDQLSTFEKRRDQLMGKGCQATIDAYFAQQKYASFVDIWTTEQSKYKNKKSTPEEIASVDSLFEHHLNHLKSLVNDFINVFIPAHLKEIHILTTDLWKMIVPTIYEMGERMAAHEDHKGNKNANATRIGESLKALDMESLRKMESSKEVDAAQKRIVDNLIAKFDDYMNEIDNLFKLYKESSRPSLSGRLEKLNNKEFKKKTKKIESGYYSIRQAFRYEVTENIFPEPLFCKFSLVCLEPLMQEGEVMEAVTIEKEVKRFVESHKDLLKQRCELLLDFEDGVQTGRRELAGVLGKLFLKEGMRIQGDNLALKRQNSLLKSMGVTPEEPKKKSKKKKSSATSSGASTPALITQEESTIKKTAATNEKKKEPVKPSVSEPEKKKSTDKSLDPKAVPSIIAQASSSSKKSVKDKKIEKPVHVVETIEKSLPVMTEKNVPVTMQKKSEKPVPVVETIEKSTPVMTEKRLPVVIQDKSEKPVLTEKKPEKRVPVTTEKKYEKPAPIVTEKKKKKQVPTTFSTPEESLQKNTSSAFAAAEEVEDWDQIRASVLASAARTENNTTEKKDVVNEQQDWETLRAEVLQQKKQTDAAAPVATPEPKSSTNDWSKVTTGGWSSVAAKKPVVDNGWSNAASTGVAATTNTATTPIAGTSLVSSTADPVVSEWSSTASKTSVDNGWANVAAAAATSPEVASVSATSGGWSSLHTVKKPVQSTTWSNVSTNVPTKETTVATSEKEDNCLGGWGTPASISQVSPTTTSSSSNNAWSTATTGGWNTPVNSKRNSASSWSNSPAAAASIEKKTPAASPASWDVASPVVPAATTVKTDADLSLGGWGNPTASGNWKSKSSAKTSNANTWAAAPAPSPVNKQSNGWNGAQLPWDIESSSAPTAVKSTSPVQQISVQKKASEVSAPPGMAPIANAVTTTTTTTTTTTSSNSSRSVPPGMTAASPSIEMTSPSAFNKAPPGLATATATTTGTKFGEPLNPINIPTPTTSIPLGLSNKTVTTAPPPPPPSIQPSLAASLASTMSQLQDPLPTNLNELDAASLLVIVMSLHRENGTLIQSVYTMQQEMSMLSNRYAEVMNLTRERESQTLALFESRKQTEMEEARRYVLSLEARIKQMEEQLKGNVHTNATIAGFGNQDLFAGYREEMSTGSSGHSGSNNGGATTSHHHNNRNHHHQNSNNSNNSNQHHPHQSRKIWQKNNVVVRCGNCGEVGHASAECKSYCRYCGSLEHLSEACPMN